MSVFPETPVELLRKLAAQVTGEDEENWARFAELYVPAIENFVKGLGSVEGVDDVVQEVMIGLVKIFRERRFLHHDIPGNFRAYLAKMIKTRLYMIYRRERSRGLGLSVPVESVEIPMSGDSVTAHLDVEWAVARHHAAEQHVLQKTLISDLNKNLYRTVVIGGRSIAEVARMYGVTKNQVSQAKARIGKMIAAIEAEFGE